MQASTGGVVYEFSQSSTADQSGAIPFRVRTDRLDGDTDDRKAFGEVELVGDKVSTTAYLRWSDDDYTTNSVYRPISLSAERSRARRTGSASRRSFEVLHVGNALVRLDALELDIKQGRN